MSGQIGYATDGVALNFNVWTEHLTDEWLEATKFDYEELVFD